MSDRTYFQAYVYDFPPDEREALAAVLAELLGEEPFEVEAFLARPGTIELAAEEVGCGTVVMYTEQLVAAAPGATWQMWEDPKYEYLGDLAIHTPALGLYTAECSSVGEPVLTWAAVEATVTSLDAGGADAVARLFGRPWFDVIAGYTRQAEAAAAERRCRVCACTDDNCAICIEKTGQPCWWVAADLCSACLPAAGVA